MLSFVLPMYGPVKGPVVNVPSPRLISSLDTGALMLFPVCVCEGQGEIGVCILYLYVHGLDSWSFCVHAGVSELRIQ